jgi:trehalose-phosphatase
LPGALRALHDLSRELAVVAAISGRSATFLASRLEVATHPSPIRAIGLHGLEEWRPDGTVELRPGVSAWRPAIEAARNELQSAVPKGVKVEDKGYGVTVHWRSVEASGPELESIAARATAVVLRVGAELDLVPRSGKASVELALPLGIDKGTVVTELCRGLEVAAFLGDDSGDVLAFLALDRLRDSSGLRPLKIAVDSAEAPRELIEEADLVLEGPPAAASFLEKLALRLRPG